MLILATREQGAPNGGQVLYQGEMGCLLFSCADSPVESEGGHKGGGGLFQGSLIRGRLRIRVWELI